eukprot:1082674-Pleurochrysis_carterae.AAC.3
MFAEIEGAAKSTRSSCRLSLTKTRGRVHDQAGPVEKGGARRCGGQTMWRREREREKEGGRERENERARENGSSEAKDAQTEMPSSTKLTARPSESRSAPSRCLLRRLHEKRPAAQKAHAPRRRAAPKHAYHVSRPRDCAQEICEACS